MLDGGQVLSLTFAFHSRPFRDDNLCIDRLLKL